MSLLLAIRCIVHRGQSNACWREEFVGAGQTLEDRSGGLVLVGPEVVVGDHQLALGRTGSLGCRLYERLGFGGPPRPNQDHAHGAVRLAIGRGDCERLLDRSLRLLQSAHVQVVGGESEPSLDRSGVEFDSLLETRLRFGLLILCQKERTHIDVARCVERIDVNGLLNLLDSFIEVLRAGDGAPEQDVRIDASSIYFEGTPGAGGRILELAGRQEVAGCAQLGLGILGQQVGGTNEFPRSVPQISSLFVGFAEFFPCRREQRVGLDRVAVGQDRLRVLLFFKGSVAPGKGLVSYGRWVGTAGCGNGKSADGDETPAGNERDLHRSLCLRREG